MFTTDRFQRCATRLITFCAGLLAAAGAGDVHGQFARKLVLAHHMPCYPLTNPYVRGINPYNTNALKHEPRELVTQRAGLRNRRREAPLMGACWFKDGMVPWAKRGDTLLDGARCEIQSAIESGIDGFVFQYGAGFGGRKGAEKWDVLHSSTARINAYFEVAEEQFPDFKMTVCLDEAMFSIRPDRNQTREKALYRRQVTVEQFLARHIDSPNLLRTEDGNVVITSYRANNLGSTRKRAATVDGKLKRQEQVIRNWQQVWRKIEEKYGEEIFFVADLPNVWQYKRYDLYQMPRKDVGRLFRMWAEAFDGISMFGVTDTVEEAAPYYQDAARIAHEAGSIFICPVWFGYCKSFPKGRILMQGSAPLRNSWQVARESQADAVQVVTWNDYGEYSNHCPGINLGYTLQQLTAYLGDWYRSNAPPGVEQDTVFLFYRRYPHQVEATDFPADASVWLEMKNQIEVLVLAENAAELVLSDHEPVNVPAGMSRHVFPLEPGRPRATLLRDGRPVAEAEGLAEIIDGVEEKPYRRNLGTVAVSSNFKKLFHQDTGKAFDPTDPMWRDVNENGLADWYELIQAGSDHKVLPAGVERKR